MMEKFSLWEISVFSVQYIPYKMHIMEVFLMDLRESATHIR